jgi:hypothetical protein
LDKADRFGRHIIFRVTDPNAAVRQIYSRAPWAMPGPNTEMHASDSRQLAALLTNWGACPLVLALWRARPQPPWRCSTFMLQRQLEIAAGLSLFSHYARSFV